MTKELLDRRVDEFVTRVNTSNRRSKLDDEVAPSVASPSEEDPDWWEWAIRPYAVTWVEQIESRLPRRFPRVFHSFVSRYIYPEFEWGNVSFFGNTPEGIGYRGHELREAIFRDPPLFEVLARNGFIQFGLPDTGMYDPVCFAPSPSPDDAPVVRIDHEDVLIRGTVRIAEEIAESFSSFIAPGAV